MFITVNLIAQFVKLIIYLGVSSITYVTTNTT